jgi:hypothetical protein
MIPPSLNFLDDSHDWIDPSSSNHVSLLARVASRAASCVILGQIYSNHLAAVPACNRHLYIVAINLARLQIIYSEIVRARARSGILHTVVCWSTLTFVAIDVV